MDLKKVFEEIDFVNRYKKIYQEHHDFDSRLDGHNKEICNRVMDSFGYTYRYVSNGSFYQIKDRVGNQLFQLHLVLKHGIVEILLYIYSDGKLIEPNGRLDFFPEDMGIPFEHDKYNLFFYHDEQELKVILGDFFGLYEDLKSACLKQG